MSLHLSLSILFFGCTSKVMETKLGAKVGGEGGPS